MSWNLADRLKEDDFKVVYTFLFFKYVNNEVMEIHVKCKSYIY